MNDSNKRQPVTVRAAREDDREFIFANIQRISEFGVTAWRPREAMVTTDTAVIESALAARPNGEGILVAESSEGVALGFIHVTAEADYYSRREQAHIADLVVAKEGEGRGVGMALMEAGEGWARERGFELLTLNVFVGNVRARELYERAGFAADTLRYIKAL